MPPPPDTNALRDGDTVVFLGDSITAARTYGKIVEDFTLLRYPCCKDRFHNAGRGGDTAAGGLAHLEPDVFGLRATVLVVAYGINDINWGTKTVDEYRQTYLDEEINETGDAAVERQVRTSRLSSARCSAFRCRAAAWLSAAFP